MARRSGLCTCTKRYGVCQRSRGRGAPKRRTHSRPSGRDGSGRRLSDGGPRGFERGLGASRCGGKQRRSAFERSQSRKQGVPAGDRRFFPADQVNEEAATHGLPPPFPQMRSNRHSLSFRPIGRGNHEERKHVRKRRSTAVSNEHGRSPFRALASTYPVSNHTRRLNTHSTRAVGCQGGGSTRAAVLPAAASTRAWKFSGRGRWLELARYVTTSGKSGKAAAGRPVRLRTSAGTAR